MTFFSVRTLPEKEISNFIDFAHSFKATIKFTREVSSEKDVFLDTEVFKGPRFADNKTLNVRTHYKPTEQKRFSVRTSLQVTLSVLRNSRSQPLEQQQKVKKGSIKEETLRLPRTNSVKETFEIRNSFTQARLPERTRRKYFSRSKILVTNRGSTKQNKNILECFAFHHDFNPATPNLKKVLSKHWHLAIVTGSNRLGQIFSEPPIVAYRKGKSLKDLLVRAKIPSHI